MQRPADPSEAREEAAGGSASPRVVRMALTHPMRAWVEALERLLEPRKDIEVVSAHTDVDWARHAVTTGQADMLVTHVEAPAVELFTTLRELFTAVPSLSVVAISDAEDPVLLSTALRIGVRGWVGSTSSIDHLMCVLHGVSRGETWVPPRMLTGALQALIAPAEARQQASGLVATLSARELQILQCLTLGLSRQEIAERYTLSPHTVRTHINNLLHKLNVHSTLAAVSVARRAGVLDSLPRQRGAGPSSSAC